MTRHGFRVHTEWEDYGNTLAVWYLHEVPGGVEYARSRTGGYIGEYDWEKHTEGLGSRPEPTYRFPRWFLNAFLAELSANGVEYAGDATVNHLKDAVAVRDRLLAIVEGR